MLFSVAMSSAAPHVGGALLELPAWIMFLVLRALPTSMSQLSCEAASTAGVHVPDSTAMG